MDRNSKKYGVNIFSALVVTGGMIALISLFREGVIYLYNVLLFWSALLPIAISIFASKWVYNDCQKRGITNKEIWSFATLFWILVLPIYLIYRRRFTEKNYPKVEENETGFRRVVGKYLSLNIALSIILFALLIFVFRNRLFYSKPSGVQQNVAIQEVPTSLSIGGLGSQSIYYWDSSLQDIPDGFYYKRTDSRGYKIYAPRSSSIIQWKEPDYYPKVVVEKPNYWIGLFIAK
jgi:hypothetical protein